MQTRAASRCAEQATRQPQFKQGEQVENEYIQENPAQRQGSKRPARTALATNHPKKHARKAKPGEPQNQEIFRALPHGLGTIHNPGEKEADTQQIMDDKDGSSNIQSSKLEQEQGNLIDEDKDSKTAKRVPRRTKENPYGLMPGRTPFPGHEGPTAAECQEVHDILERQHEVTIRPARIPPPSAEKAGCGEVPDVLDGLMRTLISGHTTMANADKAIRDVISKYGQLDKDGIGGGSINWDKVRQSTQDDLQAAIKSAGLMLTKSTEIKNILDTVYEENQIRRAAFATEKKTGEQANVLGAAQLTQGQKDHQILKIDSGILTLDHIRGLKPDDAMLELTKYPGIGVKTASCLLLFCLHYDSFAVDTHVWRMCKWLGWVPEKASRDDTYMHCELRVPNHLKYGLHQLFIKHGKECGRCRGNTAEGTSDWNSTVCPLEHLLNRFDKRKTKVQPKQPGKVLKGDVKADISEKSVELEDTDVDVA